MDNLLEQQFTEVLAVNVLLKKIITDNQINDSIERSALLSAYKRIEFVTRSLELRFIKDVEGQGS